MWAPSLSLGKGGVSAPPFFFFFSFFVLLFLGAGGRHRQVLAQFGSPFFFGCF